jgi:hypothetical protein
MPIHSTVPHEFARDLGYLQPEDISQVMSTVIALGAEVFMLKAELKRLQLTLSESGLIDEKVTQLSGEGAAFKAWLAQEQNTFAQNLLDPVSQLQKE